MDNFERKCKQYMKTLFRKYPVSQRDCDHPGLESWCQSVLGSQFENSRDPNDKISIIQWVVESGDEEDFMIDNFTTPTPFKAIIKTPTMEYWYTNIMDNDVFYHYTGKARRIPAFNERNKVIQAYYHTNSKCAVFDACNKGKSCKKVKQSETTKYHLTVAEQEKLAEEIY